jgi:hypothetical protein
MAVETSGGSSTGIIVIVIWAIPLCSETLMPFSEDSTSKPQLFVTLREGTKIRPFDDSVTEI